MLVWARNEVRLDERPESLSTPDNRQSCVVSVETVHCSLARLTVGEVGLTPTWSRHGVSKHDQSTRGKKCMLCAVT